MREHGVDDRMRAHFEESAGDYDDWWLGTGRFGQIERPGRPAEVERLIGVVRSLPPARVLDVGCGTGFLTRHLRGDVVALDQSARMVEIAAARLPHGRVVQGGIAPLPFDDGAFDRVFTSHFLHHLPDDQRTAFIAEARRVGRELVVVEDHATPVPGARATHDSHHGMHRHSFAAAELISELGSGRVIHKGRWFVVIAAS